MNRAVGSQKRQRDIVSDAFGTHIVEKRKALAFGIVDAMSDLPALAKHDRQRAVPEFRQFQEIEIRAADGNLGARLPDEIKAENVGMQGPNKDAGAP